MFNNNSGNSYHTINSEVDVFVCPPEASGLLGLAEEDGFGGPEEAEADCFGGPEEAEADGFGGPEEAEADGFGGPAEDEEDGFGGPEEK